MRRAQLAARAKVVYLVSVKDSADHREAGSLPLPFHLGSIG